MRWLLVLLALSGCSLRESNLRPFHSDGCSGFPDGDWQPHCVVHDMAYWRGGSAEERLEADRVLRRSVAEQGHPLLAEVLYLGVRLGGAPCWPTPWRWGFGWNYPRGYASLTSKEAQQVEQLLMAQPRDQARSGSIDVGN